LIAANQKRKQKKLVPTKPPGKDIVISVFEDELEEAHGLAHQVKELTDEGASLRDIAVFYRVNAMSRVLEEAFIRNKIPYQIVRGTEFYSRKEIRNLLAYLKILVNPDDEIALLRIINSPARGIGKTTIDRVRTYAAANNITLFDAFKNAGNIDSLSNAPKAKIAAFVNMLKQFKKNITGKVAPLAERIFAESGLKKSLQTAEDSSALENVNELINAAAQYDQQAEEPSLLDYLQQIALFSDVDAYDDSKGCVALMTLHCAKGLEFENVFIVGVEEGLLPHERSNTEENEDELEEERRLFFVGITRAKAGLHISYARYRKIRGQTLRTIPSQFLFELGTDFADRIEQNQYLYDDTDNTGQTIPHLAAGQLVRHKSFGLGIVEDFIDMGQNSVVVVKFNTGQTKSLMLKYANLSKI
jgi:DNA helicase-2/ATP-dependent DNA helicase PcrA